MTTVRGTGEFGLLARLAATVVGADDWPGRVRGIGDDAAIWRQPAAGMVATADMLVEGIHFDLGLTGWRDLGWKALAVNLSDVAAMGASPLLALVSLGLPAETPLEAVDDLYAGLRDLAVRSGCAIAGGDTVSVRRDVVISVTVLGGVPDDEVETLLRRDAGRPGDVLAVTGTLGASAAGLWALQASAEREGPLADAHRRPTPRLRAGQALRRAGVRCAMDVSDGLLGDLEKLCAASGCGAEVDADRIPINPAALARLPDRALEWALGGGEDYELLCAAPADVMARAAAASLEVGVPLTEIGRLTPGAGVRLLDADGAERPRPAAGWDHFAGRA